MVTTPSLEVRDVVRVFGKTVAVGGVSFQVAPGEICGFIGPNGAGKTTTMRICATLDLPTTGDVLVEGRSVIDHPRDVRKRLGFMPDGYGAYSNTTVWEYLDFFARAHGLHGSEKRRQLGLLIDFTSLGSLLPKPMTALSKGMKQRLCLAKTLIHDPRILILDEPAAGLDPRARIELRELVKTLAELGKSVLISSHILTELADVCHSVIVIEHGRLLSAGNLESLTRGISRENRIFVRALEDVDTLERAFLEEPMVESCHRERSGVVIECAGGPAEAAALLASLVRKGLRPVEWRPEESDLEDVFLSLTRGELQ